MSMFTVTGEVRSVFYQPGPVDPETGKLKPGTNKVQVLGDIPVNGGGSKEDLITLTIPDGIDFEPLKKRLVRFPLGFFAPSKGTIVYFIPKGSSVEILDGRDVNKPQVSIPSALVNSPLSKS